jgi:hypothetical protein
MGHYLHGPIPSKTYLTRAKVEANYSHYMNSEL